MATPMPTEVNTFASQTRGDACSNAVDHIMEMLARGGKIANVSVGFTALNPGQFTDHGGDRDGYTVVTVVTDLSNIPMTAKAEVDYPRRIG